MSTDPASATRAIFPSVAGLFDIRLTEEQYVIHHKIFQKKHIYIQFILHITLSFSFVQTSRTALLYPGRICL